MVTRSIAKGYAAWVAVAKRHRESQWESRETAKEREFRLSFLLLLPKRLQSNSHAQHSQRLCRMGCGRKAIVIASMGEP